MEYNVKNVYDILADAAKDIFSGVKLVLLSGDGSACLFIVELEYEAVLKAHYHLKGDETYYVIEGNCSMMLCGIDDVRRNAGRSISLAQGDLITVKEKTVHSLRNGKSLSRIMITCPEDHAGFDRYFTEDYDEKM
ncbi:MAG TPA: cupin domain-containing protein [Spirochaetota bacterium]|nr:cupin domain-containing protein [Spirochaetota bacterium]